jgi:nitrite reductase/ring-hydroxylating ferredoxin subunit
LALRSSFGLEEVDVVNDTTNRRNFITSAIVAGTGFSVFAGTWIFYIARYIAGPRLSSVDRAKLIEEQNEALSYATGLNNLRLERIEKNEIAIASIDDLSSDQAKLATDYFLQPVLIYKTVDDKPIARSAVCTHLGCTVQPEFVDGKIFCACHTSYFDAQTGNVLSGPATAPLAEEPLLIKDNKVYLVRPITPIKIGPAQNPMEPV